MLSFFSSRSNSESQREGEDVTDDNSVIIEVLSLANCTLDKVSINALLYADENNIPMTQVSTTLVDKNQITNNFMFDETSVFGLDQIVHSDPIIVRLQVKDAKNRVVAWGQTDNLQSMQTDVPHELVIPLFGQQNQPTSMQLEITLRLVGDIGFM